MLSDNKNIRFLWWRKISATAPDDHILNALITICKVSRLPTSFSGQSRTGISLNFLGIPDYTDDLRMLLTSKSLHPLKESFPTAVMLFAN